MAIISEILIWAMGLLLALAVVVAVASKCISMRKNKAPRIFNGIHAKRITWIVTGMALALLLVTFVAMPAEPLIINGTTHDNTFLLRSANMCIVTSLVLLLVAIISVIAGIPRRKR